MADNEANLQAIVRDAGGTILGRGVAWSTSDDDVAVVDGNGKVTAVGVGTATITATREGHTDTSVVTVLKRVHSVVVTPNPTTIPAGGTRAFTATPYDVLGNALTLVGRTVAWSSSDVTKSTVDPATGIATGVDGGPVVIRATVDGVMGSAAASVEGLPEFDSLYFQVEGDSITSPTLPGGSYRHGWAELVPEMLTVPCTVDNFALSGFGISQIVTAMDTRVLPVIPSNTYNVWALFEVINESVILNNWNLNSNLLHQQRAILKAQAREKSPGVRYHDAIVVFTGTAGGYGKDSSNPSDPDWETIRLTVNQFYRDNVTIADVSNGVLAGEPLGIDAVVDLGADVRFGPGGLERGTRDGDSWPNTAENVGGMLDPEMPLDYDLSGVHPVTPFGHVAAKSFIAAVQGLAGGMPTKNVDVIELEYMPIGVGTAWTAFPSGGLAWPPGEPMYLRARAGVGGVPDPWADVDADTALRAGLWRATRGDCDFHNEMGHQAAPGGFRSQFGAFYHKAGGAGAPEIAARHGNLVIKRGVSRNMAGDRRDTNWWIGRIRRGWWRHYAGGSEDGRALADNRVTMDCDDQVTTTGGLMVYDQRVTQWKEPVTNAGPTVWTVPAGGVGPYLRRELASFPYAPGDIHWRHRLAFDGLTCELETPLMGTMDLLTNLHLHLVARITGAVSGSPKYPLRIQNASGSQMIAIDADPVSPRLHVKKAGLDEHIALTGVDRITGAPKYDYIFDKRQWNFDGTQRVTMGIALVTTGVQSSALALNFASEPMKMVLGGVPAMDLFGLAASYDSSPNDDGAFRQNMFLTLGY